MEKMVGARTRSGTEPDRREMAQPRPLTLALFKRGEGIL
jgi:hypothetical protein